MPFANLPFRLNSRKCRYVSVYQYPKLPIKPKETLRNKNANVSTIYNNRKLLHISVCMFSCVAQSAPNEIQ